MTKTALITGVSGQDGHYLSEHLLGLGYEVYGLVRRTSAPPQVPDGIRVVDGDITDLSSVMKVVKEVHPDEIYNLAAQSHVGVSFASPFLTAQTNALGAHNVFEASHRVDEGIRIYQAGTSEMFGGLAAGPYNERTPFHPRSPYAASKVYAHHMAVHYRERFGMHISNGILFNHESVRRPAQFVTRKVTRGVARIKYGLQQTLTLGNLDAIRDWGFAGDYVRAMHLMVNHEKGDDFVVGTGASYSVRDLVNYACAVARVDPECVVGYSAEFRPTDVPALYSDPHKAMSTLGWYPTVRFFDLIEMMVYHDLALARKEADG